MRIAIFYPRNFFASWYALGGYKEALERMGHEVTDCPFPGNEVRAIEELKSLFPGAAQLAEHDAVVSFYHEYNQPWLKELYGQELWRRVMDRVPVIARFDESMDRPDLQLPDRVPELLSWATHYSWPAAQDAERFGGQFLCYGADTTIFHPECSGGKEPHYHANAKELCHGQEKKYNVGFVGSLYQKRHEYLQRLASMMPDNVVFNCGQCSVQDLSGIRGRESTELLAENYRQIKVFFCLPPLSRLLVAKVFEVMACGTFIMYPKMPWSCRGNMVLKDKEEIIYYDVGYMGQNIKQLRYYLEHDEERERIAAAGCKKVHSVYTLENMLDELLGLATPARVDAALKKARDNVREIVQQEKRSENLAFKV